MYSATKTIFRCTTTLSDFLKEISLAEICEESDDMKSMVENISPQFDHKRRG